ncbi:hypothetical protein SANTM175S_00822 [Streptomyces antimycoticus]
MVGGRVRDEDGGGVLVGHAVGQHGDPVGAHEQELPGAAVLLVAHDAVADRHRLDTVADGGDDTGVLAARREGGVRLHHMPARDDERVMEVEADVGHLDHDLPRARTGHRQVGDLQDVGSAEAGAEQCLHPRAASSSAITTREPISSSISATPNPASRSRGRVCSPSRGGGVRSGGSAPS